MSSYCFLLKHKEKGFYFPVVSKSQERGLYRLKKALYSHREEWQFWINLTYSDTDKVDTEGGVVCSPQLIYLDNDRFFKKLKSFVKLKCVQHYPKATELKNLRFEGKIMTKFLRSLNDWFSKTWFEDDPKMVYIKPPRVRYFWKYEEGKQSSRPHWHLLLSIPKPLYKPCHFCLYWKIHELWGHGFVDVKYIKSSKMLKNYLNKYYGKFTNLKYWQGKRTWSKSQGLTKVNDPSEWIYCGASESIDDIEYYMQELSQTKKVFKRYYSPKFYWIIKARLVSSWFKFHESISYKTGYQSKLPIDKK